MNRHGFLFLPASFIAGFSLMTIELTASRIIAPYVGSSIYTWTSVIGVILLGLSLGYYAGGAVADKYYSINLAWLMFVVSSVSVAAVPVFIPLSASIAMSQLTLPAIIVLISFLLFFVPALFLGTLSPIILKQYAASIEKIGLSAGTLSALWSLGSISGTFLTGFLFIGYMGSSATIFSVAILLVFTSLIFCRTRIQWLVSLLCMVLLLTLFLYLPKQASGAIYSTESDYYTIRVADGQLDDSKDVRIMFLDFDSHSIESRNGKLLGTYPEIYPIFSVFKNPIKKIFVIGGGSYSMPKYFSDYYKDSEVTVAEIDPEVTRTAEKFFDLDQFNIKTEVGDGRLVLGKENQSYDLIFEDAFNSFISLPWHLTTKEFTSLAKSRLSEGGIYAVNFISTTKGDESGFFKSMLKTFEEVFPNTYVFTTGEISFYPQSVVLIGINSSIHKDISDVKNKLLGAHNGQWLSSHIADASHFSADGGIILSDNFAPVERLMMPAMNEYFRPYSDFFYSFIKI